MPKTTKKPNQEAAPKLAKVVKKKAAAKKLAKSTTPSTSLPNRADEALSVIHTRKSRMKVN